MESKIFAKLNFDPGILVILSIILTIIALALAISLLLRQTRLENNYKSFMRGKGGRSLEEAFKQQFENIDMIKEQTDLIHKRLAYVEKSMNKSYQKCGIVRYDAFKELGGQLSFAYAMLNDSNTGFVMNCIHSREGSYTYIKDIVRGECEIQLCNEEAEAIARAMDHTSASPSSADEKGNSTTNKKIKIATDTASNIIKKNLKTKKSNKKADDQQ